jgi:DNA anti-recombination protein RmuC
MMPTNPFQNAFSLAPQKLAQVINPLYWLTSGTGQIGFVNISGTASAKPEVEAEIIENVATYGRQLGRISDVLEIMLRELRANEWRGADKQALEQFEEMNAQIAAVKAEHLAPTKENVDMLIEGIQSLKQTNGGEYRRIKEELKKRLFDGDNEPAAPLPSKRRRTSQQKAIT